MSQWDSKTGQQGLAAWRADRADLRAAIEQAAEDRPLRAVGASAAWSPRCRCGELATHELVWLWIDVETRRAAVCDAHYHAALDAPAVDGLRILVAS